MKVLCIEDNEQDIQGIKDYCDENNYEFENKNFDTNLSFITEYDPDILVLDLKNQDEEFEGCQTLEEAWQYSFRPTCIFSAQINESTVEQDRYKSPLVAFYNKGDETPVKEFIKKIAPYADCIREVRKKASTAMRKSFDFFELAMADNVQDPNTVAALCGNRIKAFFEENNKELPIWGQYIYPVFDDLFSTGDIIELKESTGSEKSFWIILSQSCDIARNKIENVLIAECNKIDLWLDQTIGKGENRKKKTNELNMILNAGYYNQFFPLPGIDSVFDDSVIDLKKIHTVPLDDLKNNYRKILSLSSPYKERLIWAYMQTSCRPGVPDLNVEQWTNKLVNVNTHIENAQSANHGKDTDCGEALVDNPQIAESPRSDEQPESNQNEKEIKVCTA